MAKHPITRLYDSWSQRPRLCLWCGEPTGEAGVRQFGGGKWVEGWWNTTAFCSNACKMREYRARKKLEQASS